MNPYSNLDDRAYWKRGVEAQHPLAPVDLYRKKFDIGGDDRIATAGSCFAQHIARHMRSSGYQVIDAEPPPKYMPEDLAKTFGFNLYSARYGNIYTTRQLLQLAKAAFGKWSPSQIVWEKNGRYYDALRPSVEPEGLSSPEEVMAHRLNHLHHVARMMEQATVFIFTFGLTETWEHIESGTVYPTAPGVIAGRFDPQVFRFKNLTFAETLQDFLEFRKLVRAANPTVKFLVTVSPVPLTATASGEHVLSATSYSKSVLRAVAGQLYHELDDVDYFPSYEIIASHPSRGFFYKGNMREVDNGGVNIVMKTFFSQHRPAQKAKVSSRRKAGDHDRIVCEEALLEAFG